MRGDIVKGRIKIGTRWTPTEPHWGAWRENPAPGIANNRPCCDVGEVFIVEAVWGNHVLGTVRGYPVDISKRWFRQHMVASKEAQDA